MSKSSLKESLFSSDQSRVRNRRDAGKFYRVRKSVFGTVNERLVGCGDLLQTSSYRPSPTGCLLISASPGTFVTKTDVARIYISHSTRELHPDTCVAAGNGPRPLPDKGRARRDRSLLLRLRIGCYRTAERLHRLTGRGSPFCADCAGEETLEHLLRCPNADAQRQVLLAAYRRLGLPRSSVEHLLFPACARSSAGRALTALLECIEAARLRGRL
ncbi:hypothetical protein HPB50_019813 [Hyalomma asiaticum]|uniref:Uncharacterized protein n=1 Tax=Hyalomma asiaticum TaxID=266040 RepID=A0ACB7RS14_HYAAI|nr:hypothetical protein HPB50_019813 [Hyalomma asiaticum]